MKPINEYEIDEWSFNDCVDWLAMYGTENIDVVAIIAKRLRELHEKHRWIPVEERLPTENDAIDNKVYWIDKDGYIERMHYITGALYEWEAWRSDIGFCANVGIIDKPEGV